MAARWAGLMNRLNVPSTVGNKWFQTVSKRYTEPQRHYHTLAHISELMGFANQFKAQIKSTELVELSIWFHEYP